MSIEQNLRVLYALRSDYGSLTTRGLASEMSQLGLTWLDEVRLGAIFRNERSLSPEEIKQIEQAFGLREGWFGFELGSIDKLSILDVELMEATLNLSDEKKKALREFLVCINK